MSPRRFKFEHVFSKADHTIFKSLIDKDLLTVYFLDGKYESIAWSDGGVYVTGDGIAHIIFLHNGEKTQLKVDSEFIGDVLVGYDTHTLKVENIPLVQKENQAIFNTKDHSHILAIPLSFGQKITSIDIYGYREVFQEEDDGHVYEVDGDLDNMLVFNTEQGLKLAIMGYGHERGLAVRTFHGSSADNDFQDWNRYATNHKDQQIHKFKRRIT